MACVQSAVAGIEAMLTLQARLGPHMRKWREYFSRKADSRRGVEVELDAFHRSLGLEKLPPCAFVDSRTYTCTVARRVEAQIQRDWHFGFVTWDFGLISLDVDFGVGL